MANEQILKEAIEKAERSEGYMIVVSKLNSGILTHAYFTSKFRREDILPSIEKWRDLLKGELSSTDGRSNREAKIESGEKKLPPRYRKVEL